MLYSRKFKKGKTEKFETITVEKQTHPMAITPPLKNYWKGETWI